MNKLIGTFIGLLFWCAIAQAQYSDHMCVTSASQTLNYNELCLTASASGGNISVTNFGSASGGLTISSASGSQLFVDSLVLPPTASETVGTIISGVQPFVNMFHNNLFVGIQAGNFTLTGTSNFGFGQALLTNLTTGSSNAVIGNDSALALTTGVGNVAIGNNALQLETTGGANVAIGLDALLTQNGANSNIGVGELAGADITTGAANTFVGSNTGRGVTTGIGNTIIGNVIGLAPTLANAIIIADGQNNIRFDYGQTTASTATITAATTAVTGGITAAGLPTSGAAAGSLCVTSTGTVFVKTTSGACL